MKKYVLNTAVLTIASLMAADASMASFAQMLAEAENIAGGVVNPTTGDITLPGGIPGVGIDEVATRQLLGTGVVGASNLEDASTVSNRLLTAQLAVDYDAFNFAGGALPANQSISAREDALGGRIVTAFGAGGNLQAAGVDVLGGRIVTAFGPGGNLQTDGVDVLGGRIVTAFGPGGNLQTNGVDVLGPLIDAAFVPGNNLQTNGVTPVATALGVGTVGVLAPDLLGAVGEFKAILNAGAADLGEAARDIHEGIGGAALPTDAITNIDTMRDALAIDGANPGVTFASIDLARAAVNTALGAGGGAVLNKPFLTRLTGVDDTNNANPVLAGSLSGKLSIVPANDIMAQAETRRAALVAMAVAMYAGGAYGDVDITAVPGQVGLRGPHDAAGAGPNGAPHYVFIDANQATASIELVIKAFLNQA